MRLRILLKDDCDKVRQLNRNHAELPFFFDWACIFYLKLPIDQKSQLTDYDDCSGANSPSHSRPSRLSPLQLASVPPIVSRAESFNELIELQIIFCYLNVRKGLEISFNI